MAFDEFISKVYPESELLEKMVQHLQSNYSKYQNECYFLKLIEDTNQCSQIAWIKSFPDAYDLTDYYFDTVFHRACVMIKFEQARYEIYFEGFNIFDCFEIWSDKIKGSHTTKAIGQIENRKMISRELLERGFGEITETLSSAKSRKAI